MTSNQPTSQEEQIEQQIWTMLIRLAEGQYSLGKHANPAGDQFSKQVTPVHTEILGLITSHYIAKEAVAAILPKPIVKEAVVSKEDSDLAAGYNQALTDIRKALNLDTDKAKWVRKGVMTDKPCNRVYADGGAHSVRLENGVAYCQRCGHPTKDHGKEQL